MAVSALGRGMIVAAAGGAGASAPSEPYKTAKTLDAVKIALSEGRIGDAHRMFDALEEKTKGEVFESVWRICGRPRPESKNPALRVLAHGDFGRVAFYGSSCTDGKERKADPYQIQKAIELVLLDYALQGLSTELSLSGASRSLELLQMLPIKMQDSILREAGSKSRTSVGRTALDFIRDYHDADLKRVCVDKVRSDWAAFRLELIQASEEYESLVETVGTSLLVLRQKAVITTILLKGYSFLGRATYPLHDETCPTLRSYAEDVLRKNPEIASVLLMVDSTLVDAIAKAGSAVSGLVTAPIIVEEVRPELIAAMRAALPLDCAIEALRVDNPVVAIKEFGKLHQKDQWAIFGEMWRVCGRPRPESKIEALRLASTRYFGEDVFLGIPSEDGICRTATSFQRRSALMLYRTEWLLEQMKEFIVTERVGEQITLLRVMPSGIKKILENTLNELLEKPAGESANYFRDTSVTRQERLSALTRVAERYAAARSRLDLLCDEYEIYVASNSNKERKLAIINEVLQLVQPFITQEPLRLPAVGGAGCASELEYAKACLDANGGDYLPYLSMLEPSLSIEAASAPAPRLESLTASVLPRGLHHATAGAGTSNLTRSLLGQTRLKIAKVDGRFDEARTRFTHNGEIYRVLTGPLCDTIHFRNTKIVSLGAVGIDNLREAILLDTAPGKSPLLEGAYEDFKRTCLSSATLTVEEASKAITHYIGTVVFEHSDEMLYWFLSNWSREHSTDPSCFIQEEGASEHDHKSPIIPIDDFIKAKFGVCRHRALVACYFLSRLTEDRPDLYPPSGKIYHVRDNIFFGAHAWAWYVHPDLKTIQHIDPMWHSTHVLIKGGKEEGVTGYYGALNRQMERLLK